MKYHLQLGLILTMFFLAACKKESSSKSDSVAIYTVGKSQDTIGATISIAGQNFDVIAANNVVDFNKVSTTATKVTLDPSGNAIGIDVKIPPGATTGIIKVTAKNQTVAFPDTFYIVRNKYVWTKLNAFPGGARSYAVAFTVNGNSYVGTGMNYSATSGFTGYNDLWEYNSPNDTWTKRGNVPSLYGDYRANGFSFVIGNNAYVGGGISATKSIGGEDVNKYDPATDTWTVENGVTGANRFDISFAGTYQNKGLIFSLSSGNPKFYKFDPIANAVTPTPYLLGIDAGLLYSWCVSLPNQIVGGGEFDMDIIDPNSIDGRTILHPNYAIEGEFVPNGSSVFRTGIYYNNSIYMSFGDEGNLARFDLNEKLWFSVSKQKLGVGQGAVWFMVGSKIYAVGGSNGFFYPATDNVWMIDLDQYIR
jgi:hypothetical protein